MTGTHVGTAWRGRVGVRRLAAVFATSMPLGRVIVGLSSTAVLAFLVLPSILVAVMSFGAEKYLEFPPREWSLRWYETYFSDPDWIGPTLFSIQLATITAILATVVGTLAALALVRGRLPGREWLRAIVVGPMVAPAVIVAIALYLVFSPWRLVGTMTGFVLAHTMLAAPYVVLTASAALARVDPALELAAMSLGASRAGAVLRITLPLMLPAVLAGAAFAFIVSFDEAVVSFFLSGLRTKTLPKKLFEDIDFDVSPAVAAVGTLLTLISVVAMVAVEMLMRRVRRAGQTREALAAAGDDSLGASR